MPTIELTGGPQDGLVTEVSADFPDYEVVSYVRREVSDVHTYRITAPAVTTQSGRIRYVWIGIVRRDTT